MTRELHLEPSKLALLKEAVEVYSYDLDEQATKARRKYGPRDDRFLRLEAKMESVVALLDELNEV